MRRRLNLAVTILVIAVPVTLVVLAIATGQDLQTIVLIGFAFAVMGMLFKSSLPRTPFA